MMAKWLLDGVNAAEVASQRLARSLARRVAVLIAMRAAVDRQGDAGVEREGTAEGAVEVEGEDVVTGRISLSLVLEPKIYMMTNMYTGCFVSSADEMVKTSSGWEAGQRLTGESTGKSAGNFCSWGCDNGCCALCDDSDSALTRCSGKCIGKVCDVGRSGAVSEVNKASKCSKC